MNGLVKAIGGVSGPWSLAAFAIAAVLYIVLRRKGKVQPLAWAALAAIVILGLVPVIAHLPASAQRVRVTVLDPSGTPVENAKVWSSIGGEPKKVPGGWEFELPAASAAAATFYASVAESFLTGKTEVDVAKTRTAAIQLARDASAVVRGAVLDARGAGVAGARVSVAGYDAEAVRTGEGGGFQLPAHAAAGQQVLMRAEKAGYAPASQWHPAGAEPAVLTLERAN